MTASVTRKFITSSSQKSGRGLPASDATQDTREGRLLVTKSLPFVGDLQATELVTDGVRVALSQGELGEHGYVFLWESTDFLLGDLRGQAHAAEDEVAPLGLLHQRLHGQLLVRLLTGIGCPRFRADVGEQLIRYLAGLGERRQAGKPDRDLGG